MKVKLGLQLRGLHKSWWASQPVSNQSSYSAPRINPIRLHLAKKGRIFRALQAQESKQCLALIVYPFYSNVSHVGVGRSICSWNLLWLTSHFDNMQCMILILPQYIVVTIFFAFFSATICIISNKKNKDACYKPKTFAGHDFKCISMNKWITNLISIVVLLKMYKHSSPVTGTYT